MQLSQNVWNDGKLIKTLKDGGVVVMPTDTLYGIVGQAENISVVNRIYNLKRRAPEKPCITLIGDIAELEKFSVNLSEEQKNILQKYWPGPVSIILDCLDDSFLYLHCETKTLAFRIPASVELRNLLLQTGPLVAPSANPEGLPPAQNIAEAQKYFGDSIDLYIDKGEIFAKASKIIRLSNNESVIVIRD